ncbi:protein Lines homolog 1 [Engraulis encrasicolus]|uniref:protein Lines homolog 1 n=1 Tax=Engraulis encrasicolus TaxID=184585 RepID=UPI002FD76780
MDNISVILRDVYGEFRLGARPSNDVQELASFINASISSPSVPETHLATSIESEQTGLNYKGTVYQPRLQDTLLNLSLVEKMSVKLLDPKLSDILKLYIQNLFRVLQEEYTLISSLVLYFGNKDRLLSHLAAKCVSSLLICELQSSDSCGVVMESLCDETFQMHSLCHRWDCGLWSLTTAIKSLLKTNNEHKSEQIEKLLTRIDSGVTSMYSWLLQSPNFLAADGWGTTLATFMDLLDALTAARFRLGTCVSSQRLLFTRTPALLQLMQSQAQYFVKRHVLLLLKRTVLQRSGEDWLPGALSSTALHRDPHLAEDMGLLTGSVLQAVDCGWLQHVPVRASPSFFGGTMQMGSDGRADDVMLRAVSMVLLKSLEYHSQAAHLKSGSQAIYTSSYLKELLLFLRRHSVPLRNSHHGCLCVSVVFGDQDDDMVEAARALLILHTRQKNVGGSPEATGCCETGSNPHCHFVVLLRGLAFDHSVLLDFLISSETCFLEYVVRYLKLLRGDWEGFSRSCQILEPQRCNRWTVNSGGFVLSHHGKSAVGEAEQSHSSDGRGEVGAAGASQACPRLVDYGSSSEEEEEEEEEENMKDEKEMKEVKEEKEQHHQQQEEEEEMEMDVCVSLPEMGQRVAPGSLSKDGGQPSISLPDCKQRLDPSNDSVDVAKHTDTSVARKVVLCLRELKTVIIRLQRKNLFPYNPVSLVKLLSAIEEKSGLFC